MPSKQWRAGGPVGPALGFEHVLAPFARAPDCSLPLVLSCHLRKSPLPDRRRPDRSAGFARRVNWTSTRTSAPRSFLIA